MDFFGIGAMLKGAMRIATHAARGTGRTTSLLENIKDGDRVVFEHPLAARDFDLECKKRGLKVEVLSVSTKSPQTLFQCAPLTGKGRLIFDHSWVEAYHMQSLEYSIKEIAQMEFEFSGRDAQDRKTHYNSFQQAKWDSV